MLPQLQEEALLQATHPKICPIIIILCSLIGCSKPYVASGNATKGSGSIQTIVDEAKRIQDESESLTIDDSAKIITTEAVKVDKIIQKQDKALFEAKNSYYQMYQRWLTAIMLLSGLAVGVSIALFIMGNIKSLTLTMVAVALFASAATLQFLSAYFIWIAGGSILLLVGLLLYEIYIKKRSGREIIESVQKGIETGAVNIEEFGPIADKFQRGPAKEMVDKVQRWLEKKSKKNAK